MKDLSLDAIQLCERDGKMSGRRLSAFTWTRSVDARAPIVSLRSASGLCFRGFPAAGSGFFLVFYFFVPLCPIQTLVRAAGGEATVSEERLRFSTAGWTETRAGPASDAAAGSWLRELPEIQTLVRREKLRV